ncbi:double-stranded RNA-binding protein 1-like [Iris pallida]|uniref:Double-stranded RNA-binding protein 1-like n=1 Tax=Iris pallida TaxID=29817 RepID=A0AAX6DXL4_IRIPA|nr:double-stranded RNA-binding protein 1-like [Iris pallida]
MEVGAPSNASGPADLFVHKNRLQEFTQRATLPLPMYQTINEGYPHAPQFRSTVVVDGHTFTSSRTFIQKKAAEQDVARIALEGISTVIKHQGVPQIQEDPTFCKSILYEYAVKMNFEKPTYTTYQEEGGPLPIFVSSSIFNGETFTGTPAKNKKEAEQMAARVVIESVLANSNTRTLMCEIIKSKGKLYAAVHKSSFSDLSCYKDVVLRSQMQVNTNSCIVKGKEPEVTLTSVNELPGNSLTNVNESSLPQIIVSEGWLAESTRVGFLKDNLNSETVGNGSEAYVTQGLPAGVVSSTNNAFEESHVQQDGPVNSCIKLSGASMEPEDFPIGALNTCRKRSQPTQGNESKKARTDEQLLQTPPSDDTENLQQNA